MHETYLSTDGHTWIKPRVLGRLHVDKLKPNIEYFISLIDSVNRDLTREDGSSLIYNLNGQILHLDETLIDDVPSFIEQAEANCFLKCFEPGFQIRLGKRHTKLYEDLVLREKDNANLLATRCEQESQQYLNNLFYRFNLLAQEQDMSSLPATEETRLQNKLKASYRQYYKSLSNETDKYVPLRFEYNRKPIELKHLFIKPRVLIEGEAGSGKTTVCQHITYSWAVGDLWRNQFKWLFHIKMRNLISQRYPFRSSNYSLIDIIEKECFPEGRLENSEDKEKLKNVSENSSKILWILDGYDERKIPRNLRFIDKKLLAQPNLLVTSRLDSSGDLRYDVKIQIQNFTDTDIEKYIHNYFSCTRRTTGNECWSVIRDSDQLLRTARIPACLQIICSLWGHGTVKLDVGMTMGQLYQKMCDHLLLQYLLKFRRLCNSSLAGRDIYREPNAIAFTHLERLAFEATKAHRLTITEEEITDVAGPDFRSILQIVLLIPQTQNPSDLLLENIYYFAHRGFQEHLSARYMIRILESSSSNEEKKKVLRFIKDEKYNRRIRDTLHLFFELEHSNLCTNEFWLAVDRQPRDLVGLRHCSRIAHWFPKKLSAYFLEDQTEVSKRTIDIIWTWISNTNRLPHDIGNKYIFESFVGATGRQCWLDAWKEDLFLEDSSKRRYFLPDLWSTENIDVLRNKYNDILEHINILKSRYNDMSKDVGALHDLITTGPNRGSLSRLNLESSLFTLYKIDDPNNIAQSLIPVQEQAKGREPITTSAEFKELLINYVTLANLNRQSAADGEITWGLKIDPSALNNIDNETLHLLLQLTERQALFFRYFIVPVIPFLKLYANQNGLNHEYLRALIVSITMSSTCILTAPPNQTSVIRVHENETYDDIEMNEHRRSSLIEAFRKARDAYGYSLFFRPDK
jgi:hypothetical protein